MSRPYYSEYVRHALRFYTRNDAIPEFKRESDKYNWQACSRAMGETNPETKTILTQVYSGYDTLPDEVYRASKEFKIPQNKIWDWMKEIERKVATARGLV